MNSEGNYKRNKDILKMKYLENFRMDWHQKQIDQILKHAGDHRNDTRSGAHDLSCRICYPNKEGTTDGRFQLFWDWYQGVTSVQGYSGKTQEIFGEIMSRN